MSNFLLYYFLNNKCICSRIHKRNLILFRIPFHARNLIPAFIGIQLLPQGSYTRSCCFKEQQDLDLYHHHYHPLSPCHAFMYTVSIYSPKKYGLRLLSVGELNAKHARTHSTPQTPRVTAKTQLRLKIYVILLCDWIMFTSVWKSQKNSDLAWLTEPKREAWYMRYRIFYHIISYTSFALYGNFHFDISATKCVFSGRGFEEMLARSCWKIRMGLRSRCGYKYTKVVL